jgi:L-serine dehydratase
MFESIAEWFELAGEANDGLPGAVLRRESKETDADEETIRRRVADALSVMRAAVDEGMAIDEPSPSGLTGGRARRLSAAGPELLGPAFTAVLARAIATLEVNARMGLIMATPTAGVDRRSADRRDAGGGRRGCGDRRARIDLRGGRWLPG